MKGEYDDSFTNDSIHDKHFNDPVRFYLYSHTQI
jgi:hypothetical protein